MQGSILVFQGCRKGVGITLGMCDVDGGVEMVVWGDDGELGEDIVITKRFGVPS